MKRLFSTRWHGIPVAIVSVLLALVLVAGGVLAAGYNFFNATIGATVEEAIYPSYGAGDDLKPYMVDPVTGNPGGVVPLVTFTELNWNDIDPISFGFTIAKNDDIDASEFLPGEQLVIPIALRNRSDAPLTIKANCVGTPGLTLTCSFETNTTGDSYKALGEFTPLGAFSITLVPHSGNYGGAEIDGQVLFIKVTAKGNCPVGSHIVTVTLTRE